VETDELGYAAILTRVFKDKHGTEVLRRIFLIFFDKIDRCSPKWTAAEIATIRENIVKLKVIPTLRYIPDEYYNFTKKVWCLVPFTIWKEEIAYVEARCRSPWNI